MTVADTLSSSVKVVSRTSAAEAKRRGQPRTTAAHSISQELNQMVGHPHTSPATLLASYVSLFTLHFTHTLAHTYQFPSSPWASTLDHYEVSAQRFRVGSASACNNERTNKLYIFNISACETLNWSTFS